MSTHRNLTIEQAIKIKQECGNWGFRMVALEQHFIFWDGNFPTFDGITVRLCFEETPDLPYMITRNSVTIFFLGQWEAIKDVIIGLPEGHTPRRRVAVK